MIITQQQFDSLLAWLGPDRDCAGRKYETIRAGLVRIFVSKGFNDAEDLADETINRVIARLRDIRDGYQGEPAKYFHGVARNIIRETLRRREIPSDVMTIRVDPQFDVTDDCLGCLERCLQRLPSSKRELILSYYLYKGSEKIEHHKQMAAQLKISSGAYRSRAHQIRLILEACITQCPLRRKSLCQRDLHKVKAA